MPARSPDRLLSQLEQARYQFGPDAAARVIKLLNSLGTTHFPDAASLIRFHEAVLFLRAFPQAPGVLRKTERLLNDFCRRVGLLRRSGADMDAFDPLEVSGIAGTQMSDTLSFDLARWLLRHMPHKVAIDREHWEDVRAMGLTMPRFLPLVEDDAFVEADTPWQRWLAAASKNTNATFRWLIERFDRLPLSPQQKAELYDSLRIPLLWDLGNSRITRTRNWKTPARIFYHDAPLISRSAVSLSRELAQQPPRFTKVLRAQGQTVIDAIREVMLVRYRELYGTTLGDPSSVVRADVGRGVVIHLWGLLPERRLPLRAYVAGFTLKNGVPINYIEAIGLCEWIEVGFNTFYTFRGGEAGWIYAQVLRCLCAHMGARCVSVYPYQLGKDNDEAIESGAFWFYRKLGFRPGNRELVRLVESEERRIAAVSKYRTPARTLRRLAADHVFYELPGAAIGAWDRFSTRNIGLGVNRHMAENFGGDATHLRQASTRSVARILGVDWTKWNDLERTAFENFAPLLAMIPGLHSWMSAEKQALVRIIRAKSARDEMQYLRLTQRHQPLRESLLRIGSCV